MKRGQRRTGNPLFIDTLWLIKISNWKITPCNRPVKKTQKEKGKKAGVRNKKFTLILLFRPYFSCHVKMFKKCCRTFLPCIYFYWELTSTRIFELWVLLLDFCSMTVQVDNFLSKILSKFAEQQSIRNKNDKVKLHLSINSDGTPQHDNA